MVAARAGSVVVCFSRPFAGLPAFEALGPADKALVLASSLTPNSKYFREHDALKDELERACPIVLKVVIMTTLDACDVDLADLKARIPATEGHVIGPFGTCELSGVVGSGLSHAAACIPPSVAGNPPAQRFRNLRPSPLFSVSPPDPLSRVWASAHHRRTHAQCACRRHRRRDRHPPARPFTHPHLITGHRPARPISRHPTMSKQTTR